MAKLICILSYVITIISILSNAQIISVNKNNQYMDVDVVDDGVDTANTNTHGLNAKKKLVNALHDGDLIQPLRNEQQHQKNEQHHTMQQQENKQLLSLQRQQQQQQQKQQQHIVQSNTEAYVQRSTQSLHGKFMNENEKHQGNSNNKNIDDVIIAAGNENNNNNNSINKTDETQPRKRNEITSMPMKTIRDIVNDEKKDDHGNDDTVTDVHITPTTTIIPYTEQYKVFDENNEFDERTKYRELDLHTDDELSIKSPVTIESILSDGDVALPADDNNFEELTLGYDADKSAQVSTNIMLTASQKPFVNTQNIYKIIKSNKLKTLKQPISTGTVAAPQLEPLAEIRTNKAPASSFLLKKQFINTKSFQHIANLYDQYQWNPDDIRSKVSGRCASDMNVYLDALTSGKMWASKASDASGRYRGQFLFGNDYWVGSLVVCNELQHSKEMDLSFFVAGISIKTFEPLMKKHVLQLGQCLPEICTINDIRIILTMDAAAVKFNEIYVNDTMDDNKSEIMVINVRRVPGDYNIWNDQAFYITIFICVAVSILAICATIYEQTIENEILNNSLSAANSVCMQTNDKKVMPFEHRNIDCDDSDTMKVDKIIANNILNGCTFELHPISADTKNETSLPSTPPASPSKLEAVDKNLKNNQQTNGFNQLNANGTGSVIGNLPTHRNGHSNNNNNNNYNNNHHNHCYSRNQNRTVNKNNDNNNRQHHGEIAKNEVKQLSIPQRLLLSFGLSTNIKTILSAKKLPQESVSCIHGMRVFSMLWTIMVHTYLQTFGISENRFSKTITERTFLYQIIGNATYAVDTFFFLSGLLVTLLFLRTQESAKNVQATGLTAGAKQSVLLIIYRYVRLTPAYGIVILINTLSLKYVYNGSVFPPGLPDHITCPNYWWRNILYVQTWFPFPQLCMIWSWYLANDMQFYIWAIILLICAKRYAKASVVIIVTFLLTSWTVSAMVSLKFNYSLRVAEPLESFGFLYEKAWTRLGPYVMGMFAGYVLNRFKSPPKVSPFINLILWIMSLCIMFLLVFGIWNGSLNTTWTAIYVSLGHSAWGFALIWITLSCKWGLARPINNLLSYRPLLPLSRLTYCTYLIHPVTQIVMSFQLKGTMHIQHALVLTIFLGNAVVSYGCALIITLLFEAPVVRVLKILFGK